MQSIEILLRLYQSTLARGKRSLGAKLVSREPLSKFALNTSTSVIIPVI